MCSFKFILKGESGYVSQCPSCGTMEIAFKTSILHIAYNEWANFCNYIDDVNTRHNLKSNPCDKIILFLGKQSPLQMLLSKQEISEFSCFLDQVDTEVKSKYMINMFNA